MWTVQWMRRSATVIEQSIGHSTVTEPNVPVSDPAAPVLVLPEVLDAGTTPETDPWSSGDVIADDQSSAGRVVASLA